MIFFPATALGLLILGVVVRSLDNCTNEAFADETYEDETDPYLARGGNPMTAMEKESCHNLNLSVRDGFYFGNLTMRWRAANECCKLKGLVLLSHPTRHLAALEKLEYNWGSYNTWLWVGTNDILAEGQYEWATGEAVSQSSPPWIRGEPNNWGLWGRGNENCAETGREGLMNDMDCDHLMNFLCEDLPPQVGVEPTSDELKICESVEYDGTTNGFMKQRNVSPSTVVNWPLAAECCRMHGWELASLQNLSRGGEAELATVFGERIQPYWTSGSNIESEEFVWDSSNDIISRDSRLWDQYSPQSLYNGRHCVQVKWRNQTSISIRDTSCNVKLGILCQIQQQCCKARDTASIVTRPGPNRFEFKRTATLETVMEFGLSLMRHLSPSKVTLLDWTLIWQTFYFEKAGVNPIPFKPSELEPPNQLEECITTFHGWIRYVATCKDNEFIYIASEVVSAENVTTFCPTARSCDKSPCIASDRWVHIATHENQELKLEDKSMSRSGIENGGKELKLCFNFNPPTDPEDFLNALLYREFTKLNPSPSTGVNWAEYYQNVTTGIPAEDYVVYGDDVPPGTFMNIYRVFGNCGLYNTDIPVFKLVLFSSDDPSGNCLVAEKENVPLEGC